MGLRLIGHPVDLKSVDRKSAPACKKIIHAPLLPAMLRLGGDFEDVD